MIDRAPVIDARSDYARLEAEVVELRRQVAQQDYERREALLQEVRAIERRRGIRYICPHCQSRVTKFETAKDRAA